MPLPQGYTLDQPAPKPPAGYKLDAQPSAPNDQPMSLIQRARAYVDRLSTVKDDPNASAASNALSRFGAGVIGNTIGVLNHPYDTAVGFVKSVTPDEGNAGIAERILGPAGPLIVHTAQSFAKDPANAAGGVVGGALLGEAAAPVVRGAVRTVARAPEAAKAAVVGSAVDKPIPGEAVTPRQQYQIAKDQGVQLDAAQATGSPALNMAKKVTNATIGGSPAYGENFAKNVNALQMEAENLKDAAAPQDLSREQFGNAAKAKLLEDLLTQKQTAGDQFDQLTQSVGDNQPSVKGVKAAAQKIVDTNQGYYDKHPDLLKGGTRTAWNIIKGMAEAPEPGSPEAATRPPDTWSDLHMLRSDLMDITRGPEYIGDRPTGWIKQMTGAVDQAMTDSSAGLTKADLANFRAANDIYSRVKDVYDNPQSPMYHIVRAPDGLTAANRLHNLKPEMVRQVAAAAPDLIPQLQRQTISRMISPEGNEVPDLQNLPSRFKRAQKEQLSGVLSPDQMIRLENLARTARQVYSTDNPSGTAVKAIPTAEIAGAGGALTEAARMAAEGNYLGAGVTAAAPAVYYAGTKVASRAMTSPAVVDSLLKTPAPKGGPSVAAPATRAAVPAATAARGQDRWAELGAAKLQDHIARAGASAGISAEDVAAIAKTPAGKQLLIQASDLDPGSKAMKNLVEQIRALQQQ